MCGLFWLTLDEWMAEARCSLGCLTTNRLVCHKKLPRYYRY
jgi:hypothetical protein